jgi:hypothetical protein
VPDQRPPRVNAGERETLLALLQYQRDSLVRKVTGVDEGAARQPLVGSGTTLRWLVKHLREPIRASALLRQALRRTLARGSERRNGDVWPAPFVRQLP